MVIFDFIVVATRTAEVSQRAQRAGKLILHKKGNLTSEVTRCGVLVKQEECMFSDSSMPHRSRVPGVRERVGARLQRCQTLRVQGQLSHYDHSCHHAVNVFNEIVPEMSVDVRCYIMWPSRRVC